jgi:hypothetical protein
MDRTINDFSFFLILDEDSDRGWGRLLSEPSPNLPVVTELALNLTEHESD